MSRRTCVAVLAASLMVMPGIFSGQSGYAMAGGPGARGSQGFQGSQGSQGSQGYLGVDIRDVNEEQMGALKLKEARGAEILRVDHDGPAGKVGLREHDVIVQMNGQAVEGEEQLRRMLRETPAGRTVSLVISRDGQQQTISAKMANREEVERQAWKQHMTVPEPDGAGAPAIAQGGSGSSGGVSPGGLGFFRGGGPAIAPGPRERGFLGTMMGLPYTGAMLEPVGPQLAEFFGVQGGTGLLVRSVDADSPAAMAGLKAGDVVVKLNQTTVAGIGDWSKTVHDSKGKPVPVTVLREKKEQTLTLTPDPKRRSGLEWPDFGPGFAGVELPDTEVMMAEMRPLLLDQMDEVRGDVLKNSPEIWKSLQKLRCDDVDLLN